MPGGLSRSQPIVLSLAPSSKVARFGRYRIEESLAKSNIIWFNRFYTKGKVFLIQYAAFLKSKQPKTTQKLFILIEMTVKSINFPRINAPFSQFFPFVTVQFEDFHFLNLEFL